MAGFIVRIARISQLRESAHKTAMHQFEWDGKVQHAETPSTHVLLVGSIHNSWFNTQERNRILARGQYDEDFYRSLNGHFSLVIIDKSTQRIRLLANRVGGNRLYFADLNGLLLVSNRLKLICESNDLPEPNQSAIKELIDFRWTTDGISIIKGINQLQPGKYADLTSPGSCEQHTYWQFPLSRKTRVRSLSEHASNAEEILGDSIARAVHSSGKVAVLLSGGVDSAVLTAVARNHLPNLVAVSHLCVGHENPELDTARRFARELGIEHRIVEVHDSDVRVAFEESTRLAEQPLRSPSSLILFKIFESVKDDFDKIIYGEPGDAVFGSKLVKRYRSRSNKRRVLEKARDLVPGMALLFRKIPHSWKMHKLLAESYFDFFLAENRIEIDGPAREWIESRLVSDQPSDQRTMLESVSASSATSGSANLTSLRGLIFKSVLTTQFQVNVALADAFGIELISPFSDAEVMEYGATLDAQSYFGKKDVKPVLRYIGCKYFPRELMFLPKRGFPTPQREWMAGPLRPVWEVARRRLGIPVACNDDVEFCWTMAGLAIVYDYFGMPDTSWRPDETSLYLIDHLGSSTTSYEHAPDLASLVRRTP